MTIKKEISRIPMIILKNFKTNFTMIDLRVHGIYMLKWVKNNLTLSWRRPLSYRNQSYIWFLYDKSLHHERVNFKLSQNEIYGNHVTTVTDFSNTQNQRKVLNDSQYSWTNVSSRSLQCSILGTWIYLIDVDDLSTGFSSYLKLLADYTSFYPNVQVTSNLNVNFQKRTN